MTDGERLAAHRARRGVKMDPAEKARRRAERKAKRGPTHTRAVRCCRCGDPILGRMWKYPQPLMHAFPMDLSVCAKCEEEMAA